MTLSFEKRVEAASSVKPKHPSYIDPNKPTITVVGTNLGPDFFRKSGISPASIADNNIAVFVGYDHGQEASFTVNGNQTGNIVSALLEAGAKKLPAPLPAGLGASGC